MLGIRDSPGWTPARRWQNIESIVFELDELLGDVFYPLPRGRPVLSSGALRQRACSESGPRQASKKLPDLVRGIETDWFDERQGHFGWTRGGNARQPAMKLRR